MTRDSGTGLYGPAEAARRLGVPPSTLRVYAKVFEGVLSANARGAPESPGRAFRHRRYSLEDVETLGRIKALLAAGLTYDGVRAQLAGALGAPAKGADDRPAPTGAGASSASVPSVVDRSAAEGDAHADGRHAASSAESMVTALGEIRDQLDAIARALDLQSESLGTLGSRLDRLEARLDRWERSIHLATEEKGS